MKKIKSITNYNSYNNNKRYRNRISNYNKDNNENNILFNESYCDNNIAQNSFLKNDIDKNRKRDKNIFNKKNDFRKKNYEKITVKNIKENKLKNKIKNVFEIITKNREIIIDRGNNKFDELSMNELDTNFDEIMSDFSKDYREKNKIFIRKKLNEQNLNNNNNYDNDNSWNLYSKFSNYEKKKINKKIELKIKENRKLLNNILSERKNEDLKKSNLRSYNKNLSNSNSSLTRRKKTKTPIRVSSIYKVNDFKETSNKLIRYNTPAISKLLYF